MLIIIELGNFAYVSVYKYNCETLHWDLSELQWVGSVSHPVYDASSLWRKTNLWLLTWKGTSFTTHQGQGAADREAQGITDTIQQLAQNRRANLE